MLLLPTDETMMQIALKEAKAAFLKDEIPVGAVVVHGEKIIARAHNLTEKLNDVTAHAEMQVITMATNLIGGKYLNECTLYVTLEPCVMCSGALAWAQLGRLVFGAFDKNRGYSNFFPNLLHKRTQVLGGILEIECANLMKDFFSKKR